MSFFDTPAQHSQPVQDFASVQTIYVLQSGDLVHSLSDFEKVRERFAWLDKKLILTELLHVRASTETGKKSIIAVYEEGKNFRTFLNLENDFHINDLQLHH